MSQQAQVIQRYLNQHGPGYPILILDNDALQHNIQQVKQAFPKQSPDAQQRPIRLVVKSLPSPQLLNHLMEQLETRKLMVFNIPLLEQCIKHWPDADILMGRPAPAQALTPALLRHPNIHWLIDSLDRLKAYQSKWQQLSPQPQRPHHTHCTPLNINLEIDIGLHRGGYDNLSAFNKTLAYIKAHPNTFTLTGLMGYEAHIAKLPPLLQKPAFQQAMKRYSQFFNDIVENWPTLLKALKTVNSGGSLTYLQHSQALAAHAQHQPSLSRQAPYPPINDISIGSALLKPSDFDTSALKAHRPALFIATPVLKHSQEVKIPFLSTVPNLVAQPLSLINRATSHSYFIAGGYWKASAYYPEGLQPHPIIGRSSNQELLVGVAKPDLKADEYLLLRPWQSEGVVMEFREMGVFRDGGIDEWWRGFALLPAHQRMK